MPTKKPRTTKGATPDAKPGRAKMVISRNAVAQAIGAKDAMRQELMSRMFEPAKPAPGVVPAGVSNPMMALDDALDWSNEGLGVSSFAIAASMIAEGQVFLGFPLLSELAQRPEFRSISDTFAKEMTRKWIKLKAKGDSDKTDRINQLNEALTKFRVREKFREVALHEGLFGRAHIAIKTVQSVADKKERETDLGDGWSKTTKSKIKKGSVTGFKVVEPIWCYPAQFNSTDPVAEDFYRPDHWWVMGQQYHRSRLLTFTGRDVPDILKAAYAFCGLSRSQMARPYVENWLRTRQSTAEIVTAFSQMVLKTNMEGVLQGGGTDAMTLRATLFNTSRSNNGMMLVDKETEDFANVSAPLGTLDKLQAQAQEQICSVAHIPMVKYTGISPSGLNASSEGEIRVFYDDILSEQESIFKDNLQAVIGVVMHHLWGEADPDIEFEFVPLWELTEKERAELRKTEADTDAVLCDLGAIGPDEVRRRVAGDPDSAYAGLDPDEMPEPPPEEAMPGEEGEECGAIEQEPQAPANDRDMAPRPLAVGMDFNEALIERGQPGNAGQFAAGSGNGSIKSKNGKAFEVRHSIDPSGRHQYDVHDTENPDNGYGGHVAGATLRKDGTAISSVMTRPEYQRQGIASALYDHIGEHQGKPLEPNKALTEECQAFWDNRKKAAHGNPATSLIAQHEASTPRDPAAQVALGAEIAAKVGASYRVADARRRLQRSVATSDYESEGGHMTEEGHWTEQRSRLHEKLLRDIFTKGAVERATPEKGARPTVTILGGRGGSGKSWLTGPNGPVDASKTIVIDADHFKTQLPEYQGWNAADMHEESSYLVEKAAGIAMALGCNVVFDATMRSAKSAAERIEQFAKAGYDAHGFYMFASPRTACERAMKRFVGGGEKGRFVPPEVVLGNVDNERNFDAVIPNLKKWAVFDNDSGAGPKFVAGSKE